MWGAEWQNAAACTLGSTSLASLASRHQPEATKPQTPSAHRPRECRRQEKPSRGNLGISTLKSSGRWGCFPPPFDKIVAGILNLIP